MATWWLCIWVFGELDEPSNNLHVNWHCLGNFKYFLNLIVLSFPASLVVYSWSVFLTCELAILKKANPQISCDALSNFYSWKKTRAAQDIWWSFSKTIPTPSDETQAHVSITWTILVGQSRLNFPPKPTCSRICHSCAETTAALIMLWAGRVKSSGTWLTPLLFSDLPTGPVKDSGCRGVRYFPESLSSLNVKKGTWGFDFFFFLSFITFWGFLSDFWPFL